MRRGPGPAKPRGPVPMPDPFVLVFEEPLYTFHADRFGRRWRERFCVHCGHRQVSMCRFMMSLDHHWCTRGERFFVIWEAP